MPLFDEEELEGTNPKDVEDSFGAKVIPPGIYAGMLTGVKDVRSQKNGTEGVEFTFTITHGPCKGRKVTDTLWLSDATKSRKILYAHRLGLLKSVDGKYKPVEGMDSWRDAIEYRQVYIKVVTNKYKTESGEERENSKLDFEPIIKPGDKRIPEEMRAIVPDGHDDQDIDGSTGTPVKPPDSSRPTSRPKSVAESLDAEF